MHTCMIHEEATEEEDIKEEDQEQDVKEEHEEKEEEVKEEENMMYWSWCMHACMHEQIWPNPGPCRWHWSWWAWSSCSGWSPRNLKSKLFFLVTHALQAGLQTDLGSLLGEDRSIARLLHIVSFVALHACHACWQEDVPTLPRSKKARTVTTWPLLWSVI